LSGAQAGVLASDLDAAVLILPVSISLLKPLEANEERAALRPENAEEAEVDVVESIRLPRATPTVQSLQHELDDGQKRGPLQQRASHVDDIRTIRIPIATERREARSKSGELGCDEEIDRTRSPTPSRRPARTREGERRRAPAPKQRLGWVVPPEGEEEEEASARQQGEEVPGRSGSRRKTASSCWDRLREASAATVEWREE
jgi:hypothetical protein